MSKESKSVKAVLTTTSTAPLATVDDVSKLLDNLIDGEFVDVIRNRYLYKNVISVTQANGTVVEVRNPSPLAGFPIDVVQFESKIAENPDPYDNIVVRTTAPTHVVALNGTEFMEVPAGSDVLIRGNFQLEPIMALAIAKEELRQVAIVADKKIGIKDNTKTMWEFKARVSKKIYRRSEIAPETVREALPPAQAAAVAGTLAAAP